MKILTRKLRKSNFTKNGGSSNPQLSVESSLGLDFSPKMLGKEPLGREVEFTELGMAPVSSSRVERCPVLWLSVKWSHRSIALDYNWCAFVESSGPFGKMAYLSEVSPRRQA